MKRRNLFLSLICSVVLTVALATFTIVSVVKPNKNGQNDNQSTNVSTSVSDTKPNLNEDRDGSAEHPYLIYDVESFNHYVGSYGHADVANGEEICHYELADDVDFAGVNFVTLFNKGKPFNGKINNPKGFALKNISINVNRDNLIDYACKDESGKINVHIAIFGELENAEIKDVKISGISVNVSNDVYNPEFLTDFGTTHEGYVNEITVSTVAAMAKTSDVSVEVEGSINADAYGVFLEHVQGYNAVGGIVAVSNGTTVHNSKATVKFNSGAPVEGKSKNYFVGGVAGYAYYTTIKDVKINFDMQATYEQAIYVGGIAGYAFDAEIENVDVKLNAVEIGERKKVQKGDTINIENYTWVAGAVAIIKADASNKTNVTNVTINANVNIDVVYAGVVVEVWSTAGEKCVTFTDVVVASEVNVLEAFGFARHVDDCEFKLTKTVADVENEAEYNVKLTGKVRLIGTPSDTLVASAFIPSTCGYSYSNVKVVISSQISSQLQLLEPSRYYGSYTVI